MFYHGFEMYEMRLNIIIIYIMTHTNFNFEYAILKMLSSLNNVGIHSNEYLIIY